MAGNNGEIEKRLWDAADEFRANSKLKASEYSVPVLGLIFLRHADQRLTAAEAEIGSQGSGRRKIGPADYQARGVLYLPEKARFSTLLELPEGDDIGKAINEAMEAIEAGNPDLKGVLPHTYTAISNRVLNELLKLMSSIPKDIEGDAFGRIYEYFLGKFAMAEGQKGGEFFTPLSIVRLIVEVIEPYHGRIYDPACGSGGMFVQSAEFVKRHKRNPGSEISVFGQERVEETVKLGKMNLAVHGLGGDIRQANSYYEDLHESPGRFDFVMANPPFNVNRVDKDRIKDDKARFPLGMPTVDNANYLWIQLFYSSLGPKGRAGFVMANSAADARGSELEIRKQLIESGAVDVIISIGSNFFYTVTLPCTLWFFDRRKPAERKDTVLFIDARHIYRQIDRAHRDFTAEQIESIANIVRLYRGEKAETEAGSEMMLAEKFPEAKYADVAGLCTVKTRGDIEGQGWSLNPGRYVGVADRPPDEFDFYEKLEELNEELEQLSAEAHDLEERITANVRPILSR
jgi:type I restriction enzyme M protein